MAKSLLEKYSAEIEQTLTKMSSIMITSGFNFEGHVIKEYVYPVCAEVFPGAIPLTNLFPVGATSPYIEVNNYHSALEVARFAALDKLINKAREYNANGIIGLTFQYPIFGKDGIAVMVSGTSVIVE